MRIIAILVSLAVTGAYETPELTLDNYDELTDGKTVFIMFYAPWCPHSKRFFPEFDRLAEYWKYDDFGLVAKADCEAAGGRILCDEHIVRGFPSFKWGDPADLQDYTGQHDYDDMLTFTKDNLKPVCSVANLDLCDEEKRKEIEEFMDYSDDELNKVIAEEEKRIKAIEDEYSQSVAELQAKHLKLLEDKDVEINKVREAGLALLRAVRAQKEKLLFKDEL